MQLYNVLLDVRLCAPVTIDDDALVVGFYVNRVVAAHDPASAGSLAIAALGLEDKYQQLAEASGGLPEVLIEQANLVEGPAPSTKSGYVLYGPDA